MPVGPQYTKCVQPQDYEDYKITPEVIGIIAGISTGIFPIAIGAALALLEEVTDYMLNRKLICLGGDRCVIGTIGTFEEVGEDKEYFAKIDNDFCINLLLAPQTFLQFSGKPLSENLTAAQAGPQGTMLTFQAGMPAEKMGSQGYYKSFVFDDFTAKFRPAIGLERGQNAAGKEEIEKNPGKTLEEVIGKTAASMFEVPLLHCEFEGSRINDVHNATQWYPGGSSFCKKPKHWYSKLACNILRTLFSPFVTIAVVNAWWSAKEGDANAARQDPEAGALSLNDRVVIRGRWVFDAGHSGYNEVHAVRTIQKIPELITEANFFDLQARWCQLIEEVPPVPVVLGTISTGLGGQPPGGTTPPEGTPPPEERPQGMTPRQEFIYEAQRRRENRWFFHPDLDGCDPSEEEPPDPNGKP